MSVECLPLSYSHMVPCLLGSMLLQKILRKIFNSKKTSPAKGDPLNPAQLSPKGYNEEGIFIFLMPWTADAEISTIPWIFCWILESQSQPISRSTELQAEADPENRAHWWGWWLLQNSLTSKPFLPVTNTAAMAKPTEIRNSVPFSLDPQPCSSASFSGRNWQ